MGSNMPAPSDHAHLGAESTDKAPSPSPEPAQKFALSKIAGLKKAKTDRAAQQSKPVFPTETTPTVEVRDLDAGDMPPVGDSSVTLANPSALENSNTNSNNNNNNRRRGLRLSLSRQQDGKRSPKSASPQQRQRQAKGERRGGSSGVTVMGQRPVSGGYFLQVPGDTPSPQHHSKSTSNIFVAHSQQARRGSAPSISKGGVAFSPRRQSAGARPHLSHSKNVGDSGKGMSVVSFDGDEHSESTL